MAALSPASASLANEASRDSRLEWIRAIAIIFIIVIHICDQYAITGQYSRRWFAILGLEAVTRVGLTSFFVLSGFLLLKPYSGKNAIAGFYKKRLWRILPLFIVWSYIYFIYANDSASLTAFAASLVTGPIYYHLWFVYAIIGIYVVTPFASNLIVKSDPAAVRAFVVFSICAYTLVPFLKYWQINEYFYSYLIPFWMVYFTAGYLARRFCEAEAAKLAAVKIFPCVWLPATLAVFGLSFFKEDFAAPGSIFADPRPYDSNIFMFCATLSFFLLIYKLFSFRAPLFVRFLSRRAYGVYLSHAFFLAIYNKYLALDLWYANMAVAFFFVLACCLAIELGLVKARVIAVALGSGVYRRLRESSSDLSGLSRMVRRSATTREAAKSRSASK